jgi:hypothetical protein
MHPSPRGGVPLARDPELVETERPPPPERPSGIRPRPQAPQDEAPTTERRDTLPTISDEQSLDWDEPLAERPTTPAPPVMDTLIDDLLERPVDPRKR